MTREAGAGPGRLGTFGGVFAPSILTILGLILFLRLGFVVGDAGLPRALLILAIATAISVSTSVSLSAIATNRKVRGGGVYYLISRSLGVSYGGSLGLILFVAQAISAAFYCVGFGEGVAALIPDGPPGLAQGAAAGAAAVLLLLAYLGADVATRAQYLIMAVLGAALASFFLGGLATWDRSLLEQNLSPLPGGLGFWPVFAIFFPAVTGFTQGVNMSGDLKDPARSLPLGTFLAVGISTVVYVGAIVLMAGALPGAELAADYGAMESIAAHPGLIHAGVLAATASSALASFDRCLIEGTRTPKLPPASQAGGQRFELSRESVIPATCDNVFKRYRDSDAVQCRLVGLLGSGHEQGSSLMKSGVVGGFLMTLQLAVLTLGPAHAETTQEYFQRLGAEGKQRVIIKFTDEIGLEVVQKYCPVERTLGIIHAAVCEIDETKIELLRGEPGVEGVLPDVLLPIPATTRIPEPASRLYGGPVEVRWNHLGAGLNSKAAWDNYDLDGFGIRIAIIDTGIQYTLPDLTNRYLGGWDFWDDDSDPLPADPNEYHGTEVASIAVGEGVDEILGSAYMAGFYAIRAGTRYGIVLSHAISGVEWAMDPDGDPATDDGADIINMSWGSYGGDDPPYYWNSTLREACNAAYAAGIIVVAGSGNEGYDYSGWPASFENVIAVGGYAEDQTMYPSSNGGVDVVAPGVDIRVVDPDGSIWFVEGTSYAAPHASALIALQLQYARQNDLDDRNAYLWQVLEDSAVDLGLDPIDQGEGKIWAAETDPPPSTPHAGAIDLMSLATQLPTLGTLALAVLVSGMLWSGRCALARREKT